SPVPRRVAAPRATRVGVRRARSLAVLREVGEGLAVAVGPLADHALGHDVGEHRVPPPLLTLLDVRQVDLDDGNAEDLERVPDRVAVVAPRAGIDDHAAGPSERGRAPRHTNA